MLGQKLTRALHRVVDELVITGTVLAQSRRSFSRTSGPPPDLDTLSEEARAKPARIHWPASGLAFPGRVRVELPLVGEDTCLDIVPGRGPERDTLWVHHHGLGETPHGLVPRAMHRSQTLGARCDLIALKSVHHQSQDAVRSRYLACRSGMARYIAASITMARAVARDQGARYRHLVLTGMSLGGIVTLGESVAEPQFDLYVPFVSGPRLSDVLLNSAFSRTTGKSFRRAEAQSPWVGFMDLDERLRASQGPPIRPLLARSDRLFRLDRQLAAYRGAPRVRVSTFEGGHITGGGNIRALVGHLKEALRESCWTAPAGPGLLTHEPAAAPRVLTASGHPVSLP